MRLTLPFSHLQTAPAGTSRASNFVKVPQQSAIAAAGSPNIHSSATGHASVGPKSASLDCSVETGTDGSGDKHLQQHQRLDTSIHPSINPNPSLVESSPCTQAPHPLVDIRSEAAEITKVQDLIDFSEAYILNSPNIGTYNYQITFVLRLIIRFFCQRQVGKFR